MKKYLIFMLSIAAFTSCQKSFDERIIEETQDYTSRQCPKYVEPGNQLDSLTYSTTTRTITHWYSLSEDKADSTYQAGLKNNPEMYRANTLRRLINDTSWEGCKKENINFRYVYLLADTGEQVFEILLTPADYQTQK
ncbi:MAG: hypothetical protein IIW46_04735 [Bacteroidaceae bacterium]|nr:hypothetical protein [Bacteroidaceae bacterium]